MIPTRALFMSMAVALAACSDRDGASGGELCGNGRDDDGDGFVDCADQDCWSAAICADGVGSDADASGDTTGADSATPDADVAPDAPDADDGSDAVVSCDPCQDLGRIHGRVCSPSEQVFVGGADVVVTGTGCDGAPFTKTATSASDGSYDVLDVPCGTASLAITKGSFSAEYDVGVVGGQTTDLVVGQSKACFQAARTRIAVLSGTWDNLESLVRQLGFQVDVYQEDDDPVDPAAAGTILDLLGDPALLDSYDVVFADCGIESGWMPQDHPELMQSMKDFVLQGGSLYMSDYAWTYGEWSFPDAVEFYGDDSPSSMGKEGSPQVIASDTRVHARVVDGALAAYLGKDTLDVVFDQGPQIAAQSVGTGTFAHVVGDVVVQPTNGLPSTLTDAPILVSYKPAVGAGRVIYTNFHNDAQVTGDMLTIMNYLVFTL